MGRLAPLPADDAGNTSHFFQAATYSVIVHRDNSHIEIKSTNTSGASNPLASDMPSGFGAQAVGRNGALWLAGAENQADAGESRLAPRERIA